MNRSTKDILGRLCRWTLLTLAAGAVAAALGVASSAAVSIPPQVPLELCVPDAIARPLQNAVMVGSIHPLPQKVWGYLMMSGQPGKARSLTLLDGKDFRIRLSLPAPGVYPYEICGVPYGGFAFLHARCQFVVVPQERPIFIVDSALAPREANQPAWRQCLAAIGQAGQLAFLHPGPGPQFNAFRDGLRRAGIDAPVLSSYDIVGGPDRALAYLVAALDAPGAAPTALVTADDPLARQGTQMGFFAHLIGHGPPGRRTTIHKSLEDFASHLSAPPPDKKAQ